MHSVPYVWYVCINSTFLGHFTLKIHAVAHCCTWTVQTEAPLPRGNWDGLALGITRKRATHSFQERFALVARSAFWLCIWPSALTSPATTGRIFTKFGIWRYYEKKSVDKIQICLKSDKNIWLFERRRKYLYIVDDDIKYFTGAKLNALFIFQCQRIQDVYYWK